MQRLRGDFVFFLFVKKDTSTATYECALSGVERHPVKHGTRCGLALSILKIAPSVRTGTLVGKRSKKMYTPRRKVWFSAVGAVGVGRGEGFAPMKVEGGLQAAVAYPTAVRFPSRRVK